MKEINIIKSELWLSAFIIISSVIMVLKANEMQMKMKKILKAKEIMLSKITPCKPPPAE